MAENTHWDLASALDVWANMRSYFHQSGYLLTVYGSVLHKRHGCRDLDFMAVPWRPAPVPPALVFDRICGEFSLTPEIGKPYRGLMKTWSKMASDRDGRIIDFQFRRAESTIEETFEFSMDGANQHGK